ncbi:MAG: FAD-dependent oxidoreductase, partial [Dehalococcoidia bacterium]
MDIRKTAQVVIIGGGVMGASTAYHLAKRGLRDLVLLEKGYLASGPTGRSVAHIRPYHGVEETVKIIRRSNEVYLNFSEIVGGDAEFRNVGRFWAEPESKRKLVEEAVALSRSAGIRAEYISIEELEERLPGVATEGLGVAAYCPEAGYSNPSAVTASFATRAREMGAQVMEETEVTGIEVSEGKVRSVASTRGQISTPVVVNAAGIWCRRIGRMVGIDIPITPTRHQGVVFRLPWDLPSFDPIFHDGRTEYVFRCGPENLIKVMDT